MDARQTIEKIKKFFYSPGFKQVVSSKRAKEIAMLLLFGFCIWSNIYFRMFPAYFPQFYKDARRVVAERIAKTINSGIDSANFNLPNDVKRRVAAQMVREKWRTDRKAIEKSILDEYEKIKNIYQDEYGQTYLLELDPFQWMRNTRHVLEHGYPGDKKVGNALYDTYMLAPQGKQVPYARSLFYISAFLYKIWTIFFNTRLEHFLFYLPVFYTVIFLLLVYFVAKTIFSETAAILSVIYIGLNGIFIPRSCAGWYDYDTISMIIPLLIAWFTFLALKHKYDNKKLIFYSLLAGIFQGIYIITWVGWWFIFFIITVFFLISVMNNYAVEQDIKKANRESVAYLIFMAVFTAISAGIYRWLVGGNFFVDALNTLKSSMHLGKSLAGSIWPNTFYTVSELSSASIEKITHCFYGRIIFLATLFGTLWVYLKERRTEKKDFVYIMFLWLVVMIFASTKGVRFMIYLSVPLGFFFGASLSEAASALFNKFVSNFKVKIVISVILFIFLAYTSQKIFASANRTSENIYPMMNDNWKTVLDEVKSGTPKDAILNSWWDYGDIFKAWADRRVLFDGQSQEFPVANWMARVLLSHDEELSVRILKMLNNASSSTFDFMNKYIAEPFECKIVLDSLLSMDRKGGEELLLKRGLPREAINRIIGDLHNKPSPAYFIIEASMLTKMGSISFLGNWNFTKEYIRQNIREPKPEVALNAGRLFNISMKDFETYWKNIQAVSGGSFSYENFSRRYYFRDIVREGKKEGNMVYFDNGLVYDSATRRCLLYSANKKQFETAKKVYFFNGTRKEEGNFGDSTSTPVAALFYSSYKYKSIILDEPLVDSLYLKLFFLKGKKLECFKPFFLYEPGGIYVFKIDWDGLEKLEKKRMAAKEKEELKAKAAKDKDKEEAKITPAGAEGKRKARPAKQKEGKKRPAGNKTR